jgi:hypothetical protein
MVKRKNGGKAKGNNKRAIRSAKPSKDKTSKVGALYQIAPIEMKEIEAFQHILDGMGYRGLLCLP